MPDTPRTHGFQDIDILLCEVQGEELLRESVQSAGWLSVAEEERLARFTRPEAAHLFLSGRILLRRALSERLGCAPQEVRLAENAWGKPALDPAHRSDWQFNLSHSHGWLALALSRAGAIGVDIEYTARRNPLGKLAARYFSRREQAWLAEVDGPAARERFFDIWTLKEGYIKAMGQGLAVTLEGFSFLEKKGRLVHVHDSGPAPQGSVQAWLCRGIPQRPVACVLLAKPPVDALPLIRQVRLSGEVVQVLPVSLSM